MLMVITRQVPPDRSTSFRRVGRGEGGLLPTMLSLAVYFIIKVRHESLTSLVRCVYFLCAESSLSACSPRSRSEVLGGGWVGSGWVLGGGWGRDTEDLRQLFVWDIAVKGIELPEQANKWWWNGITWSTVWNNEERIFMWHGYNDMSETGLL